ncbi:alkylated DNA repair protein alkB like protein 7 [Trypanosoma theileri]|uniref:Alkylated DNA repair protein alkB like protein 7 n=1 Tax=Trypanosoma theileri TaxID=67003 RepID=A0A1X0NR19_9TRYP|nr:alkylated DNA repair protein alkB like protein 7 [Trypanosoma theileri]ORC86988.1 alkylated DNA repair protein alkB like protein 7 [Trypanosoma theileri]
MKRGCIFFEKLSSYVSLRYAPSFRQPQPSEVVGVSTKLIPSDCVPAFVIPNVITEREEKALLSLVEPWFARLPYNDGHADSLIHHFKEFYRSYKGLVGDAASEVKGNTCETRNGEKDFQLCHTALKKCRGLAAEYLSNIPLDDRVHFLRLSGNGFIRAHVDESRNSSGIIAGVCLGSARVMTLTHPKYPGERVELMLAPRCFYILIGTARYEWEHSTDWVEDDAEHLERARGRRVVEGTPLIFDGKETEFRRGERTAVIFRGVSPMELLLSRSGRGRAER